MLRALILDFDGLIIDTESTSLASWRELYARYGHEVPLDEWLTTIGTWNAEFDPRADLDRRVGRPLEWSALDPKRLERELELASRLPVQPGVTRLLDDAENLGLVLAVASSSSYRWVGGHLERLGIRRRFACVSTRDDVARTKPDPAVYRHALGCLSLEPAEALAFEDSPNGLAAAKAAGLRCVVVPSALTRDMDFVGADLAVDSLGDTELSAVLDAVGADGVARS